MTQQPHIHAQSVLESTCNAFAFAAEASKALASIEAIISEHLPQQTPKQAADLEGHAGVARWCVADAHRYAGIVRAQERWCIRRPKRVEEFAANATEYCRFAEDQARKARHECWCARRVAAKVATA